MNTPWGKPQGLSKQVADGIVFYSTASHGGYHLSAERKAQMPALYRAIKTFAGGNWYEEDCDWCLVALSFPQYFDERTLIAAKDTLRWNAENSERYSAMQVIPTLLQT